MTYPSNLPTIETNSFYEPFKPQSVRKAPDAARDRREFLTSYTQFVYKSDGSCEMITQNYEGKL